MAFEVPAWLFLFYNNRVGTRERRRLTVIPVNKFSFVRIQSNMQIMSESPLADGEDSFAPSLEFFELVATPGELLGLVVLQLGNGVVGVVAFLDVALVALVHVVVEGVLEGQREALVGALEPECHGADDGLVGAPAHGDQPGSVEQSGAYLVSLEVLLNSALLHGPANHLHHIVGLVADFDLVQPIAVPVVALADVPAVVVVLSVVVMPEVVGGIDERASHVRIQQIYIPALKLNIYSHWTNKIYLRAGKPIPTFIRVVYYRKQNSVSP